MVSMGHKEDIERFLARATTRGAAATAAAIVDETSAPSESAPWGLSALRGRLVEISARGASAVLTTAIELVIEAQRTDETAAWVMLEDSSFYPQDLDESGVDLEALVVVRVGTARQAVRASQRLLRSGSFGLVVMDFVDLAKAFDISIASQGRLSTFAQTHRAALVCLTQKSEADPSIGSLVSLHTEALRKFGTERHLRAIKDKHRGPGALPAHKQWLEVGGPDAELRAGDHPELEAEHGRAMHPTRFGFHSLVGLSAEDINLGLPGFGIDEPVLGDAAARVERKL
jgi:recombination protein RecA